jgi:hypothetical protein
MTIEVNANFTIKLGDKEIELSLAEARELQIKLTDMLGRENSFNPWWTRPNYPIPQWRPSTGDPLVPPYTVTSGICNDLIPKFSI